MKAIKIFAAVLMASMVMSCGTTPKENVKVDVELPSAALVDSVSYLLGVNFGSIIKGNNFAETMDDFNMNELKKGIADFLAAEGQPFDPGFEEQFKINPNQMNDIINGYLTARQEYKAAVNLAKEEAFLAENAKNEGVQTTESGLQYKLVSAGADYKVQPQDTVWVSYKGTLLDGTVFDQNDSTKFIANRVIKGWTEGLGLLGEGGKATLYIPSDLAYGERGNRNIAPNSTLIFDVEVLKVGKFVAKEK
jgi:FKBP-type peptidyl-prolyl cis-trans isomerase